MLGFISFSQNPKMQVNTFNTPLYTLFSPMSFARNSTTTTTTVPALVQSTAGNTLNLTNSINCEGVAATFTNKFNPSKDWQLKFTYTLTSAGGGASNADGISVVVHNDARGTGAVGGSGSSLGCDVNDSYCSNNVTAIRNGMLWEFEIYSGAGNYGATLKTSTSFPIITTISGPVSPSPVTIQTNVPIDFTLRYTASTNSLAVSLTDGTNSKSYSYTINLSTAVGTSAYLALTGGTGGSTASQSITKVFMLGYP